VKNQQDGEQKVEDVVRRKHLRKTSLRKRY
jgi:hypothetical protein